MELNNSYLDIVQLKAWHITYLYRA